MRTNAIALMIGIASSFALGCGDTGIGSGSSPICAAPIVACAGNPVGTWTLENYCFPHALDTCDRNLQITSLPTITFTFTSGGVARFSSTGTFAVSSERTRACAGVATCAEIDDEPNCTDKDADTCLCIDGGEATAEVNGTYEIHPSRLEVTSEGSSVFYDFCVEGDRLQLEHAESGNFRMTFRRVSE